MRRLLCLILGAVGMMLALRGVAAEGPVVQVQIEPETVLVGEAATLRVSVYAPTWFPQPPEFPSFELPNTITRLPPNSSGPVSVRVNGSTWSGVQRRYQVIPLIAGRFIIESRTINVTYADPQSRAPITVALPVPELTIEAEVPNGAQDLDPYLAGTSFKLERMVEGDLENLAAGDALVIRYRASIEGMPAVFLPLLFKPPRALLAKPPPLSTKQPQALLTKPPQPLLTKPPQALSTGSDVAGVSVYADEPVLSEDGDWSVREERVTLIFAAGGDFTLPGRRLDWWNVRTSSLEAAQLDDLQIRVAGSGLVERAPDLPPGGMGIWWIPGVLLVVAGVSWLARPRWQRWRENRQTARERYLHSEVAAFDQLQQLLRQQDGSGAYRALLRWLWRLEPGLQTSQLVMASTDPELVHQLQLLRAVGNETASEAPDYHELSSALAQARHQYLAQQSDSRTPALPALNP